MASGLATVRGTLRPSMSSLTSGCRVVAHQRALALQTSGRLNRHVHQDAKPPSSDEALETTSTKKKNELARRRNTEKHIQSTRVIYEKNTPLWAKFQNRHIGPRDNDLEQMLRTVGMGDKGLDDFVSEVIPDDVLQPPSDPIVPESFMTELHLKRAFAFRAASNRKLTWMNGGGFYPVDIPPVIRRNLLENPGWYTSYTPYQAEISQGRLQSLLNFQTMVSDLTGLPVANASLLDEGTAAAEAMTMSLNCLPSSRQKKPTKVYAVSHNVHPRTLEVLQGRAEGFGITVDIVDFSKPDGLDVLRSHGDHLIGAMVQYPDTTGEVNDFREVARVVHEFGGLLSAGTDLSALTLLTPPAEWGADIAFGNSQRFGVPMGYGGPHAAFFAVKEANKRRLPGRLVGVTKDRLGRPALRLALQTREQHIRREKATSNVCTAQALLANMAAMFAIYHGPQQLKEMALENLRGARMIQKAAWYFGFFAPGSPLESNSYVLSDTVTLRRFANMQELAKLRDDFASRDIGVSINKTRLELTLSVSNNLSPGLFRRIVGVLRTNAKAHKETWYLETVRRCWEGGYAVSNDELFEGIPETVRRQSSYLTHPVFNSHHSETEMLRYLHHLQSRDLSQVHSMIPLGSCTMKLNGSAEMDLITMDGHSNVHPLASIEMAEGYGWMMQQLTSQLSVLTGMHSTSIQPNSGAQGEFAGLRAIRQYHVTQGSSKRDICLIPVSAHGTNPASSAMAGMRTVPVKCEATTGNLDVKDLKEKCAKHADELAAIMITYPSTYGVFEPGVREVCKIVHEHGGQVYMDGANMNAQIGLTSPGALGADVCHLNLHKTFCIPHGGGGPGVGPICVKEHLTPYLPEVAGNTPVSSAPYGSASILPVSWGYMRLMRDDGLVKATKVALLNANYLLARLKDHYPILYTNDVGRCAHEFILDARSFQKSAGIEVADISKRLQDYGFHSPTMSFPVANTLMIEPTESESKEELDRFADALISIREEIREIEDGKQPREGNVLKMAPHPQLDIVRGDGEGKWDRPYSREKAAYPLPYLIEKKFWPVVARADDAYGDTNVFCTCPPVQDTTGE